MPTLSPSLRIGVLRGGPSPEYDFSLKSGANVLKCLSENFRPVDIFISKDGTWHISGVPRSPERIFPHVDVFWNALHGAYGEDGKLQKMLDSHKVKYTGSDSFSSALGMNKILSKEIFAKVGLKTPRYTVVKRNDDISQKTKEIFSSFLMPVVIKPTSSGSSIGVYIVGTPTEIKEAILNAFKHSSSVLAEEYIRGKEATCGVIDNFRGQECYALLPVGTANFFSDEKRMLEEYAVKAHQALGLNHFSRSDFIVTPRHSVYILETNTVPKMSEESSFTKSLKAVGVSTKDFVHHILSLALERKS